MKKILQFIGLKENWQTYLASFLLLALLPFNVILAVFGNEEVINPEEAITISAETLAQGTVAEGFKGGIKFSFPKATSTPELGLDVNFKKINEEMSLPWNLTKLSQVYEFDIKGGDVKEKEIAVSYEENKKYREYKQIFFFDRNSQTWKPLASKDDTNRNLVKAKVPFNYARVAVFSYPGIIITGKASWYAYKGGNYTASPDFPKGSRLRVHNLDNGKFVDVVVNDYGPERALHPDRPVDLDKVAFSKIASLKAGVINIKVEPLEIKADAFGRIMGIDPKGINANPGISSEAAVIMRDKDNEIVWEKNSTSTLPIASLTKMIAVKVFLDQGDNKKRLKEVVKYKMQDEIYNYEYCNKWELVKVKLKENDTLTINDLIFSSLVGSANNTVESLVRVSGLSREEFIKQMNETVKAMGAENTSFVEPTGLSPKNISTARDYALIAKYITEEPLIRHASVLYRYKFRNVNNNELHVINNTNRLVSLNKYKIIGSKTGYLPEAGYCLMSRVKHNNEDYIIVALNSTNRERSFADFEDLIKYAAEDSLNQTVQAAAFKE